jgi:hypothetical protein
VTRAADTGSEAMNVTVTVRSTKGKPLVWLILAYCPLVMSVSALPCLHDHVSAIIFMTHAVFVCVC